MIHKTMFYKILKLRKKGYTKSEICRATQISFKTVAKYYEMTKEDYDSYFEKSSSRHKVFEDYKSAILEIYKDIGNVKIPSSSVFDALLERHKSLPGSERTFRNYIRYLQDSGQLQFAKKTRNYRAVETAQPGSQVQVDFGVHTFPNKSKVYFLASVLSFSRAKFVIFQDRPFCAVDANEALLEAFTYYGGIPSQLVIDQDCLFVVNENYGDIQYTRDFKYFIEEMGLDVFVCRKADPESKGKVEEVVGFVKKNFLASRNFSEIDELNKSARNWLKRRANSRISHATGKIPFDDLEDERKFLNPLKNSIYDSLNHQKRESRKVNSLCQISVHACKYELPECCRSQVVDIFATKQTIIVYRQNSDEELIRLERATDGVKFVALTPKKRNAQDTYGKLHKEISNLIDLDQWEAFVALNLKLYPRHFRDQCAYVRKHRFNEMDSGILQTAIRFCLENKTYSMPELHDTYKHFLQIQKDEEIDTNQFKDSVDFSKLEYPNLSVASRDLEVYQEALESTERRLRV